ncbi:predicted protein [Coccidioides posadasii str. Silveira]|uniref:Predicted protein n=1 Tax=Coccidioides posadasii (strain RMSCC 757 / Silveira) TaxID=443226 RepID=E9D9X1_COCPS|nr:predicted protein [Coccidioides posadasii str. Silveira]
MQPVTSSRPIRLERHKLAFHLNEYAILTAISRFKLSLQVIRDPVSKGPLANVNSTGTGSEHSWLRSRSHEKPMIDYRRSRDVLIN